MGTNCNKCHVNVDLEFSISQSTKPLAFFRYSTTTMSYHLHPLDLIFVLKNLAMWSTVGNQRTILFDNVLNFQKKTMHGHRLTESNLFTQWQVP